MAVTVTVSPRRALLTLDFTAPPLTAEGADTVYLGSEEEPEEEELLLLDAALTVRVPFWGPTVYLSA